METKRKISTAADPPEQSGRPRIRVANGDSGACATSECGDRRKVKVATSPAGTPEASPARKCGEKVWNKAESLQGRHSPGPRLKSRLQFPATSKSTGPPASP